MIRGIVPNSSKSPFYDPPKQPTKSPFRKPISTLKFPTHHGHCSSFTTHAAVKEEGAFVGVKGGSFYELLGLSEEVGFDEVKRAYKQLARKYHPDVSPPDKTEEFTRRFIEVQEAYETLSDPKLRAMYDRDLARGLHLAFSTRRRFDEDLEVKPQWKRRWQDQVAELKRRSMNDGSDENLSWGARMRRQRAASSFSD